MSDPLTDEVERQFAESIKPEPGPMSDDHKLQTAYMILGYVNGLHPQLDKLRDDQDQHDPKVAVDHNIEQAQIALENAFLRIQQAITIIHARKDEHDQL